MTYLEISEYLDLPPLSEPPTHKMTCTMEMKWKCEVIMAQYKLPQTVFWLNILSAFPSSHFQGGKSDRREGGRKKSCSYAYSRVVVEAWLSCLLAKASFALQTFTKIFTEVMWNGYNPPPIPTPPLSFTTFCSFATLKNWNTQKQFRELDSSNLQIASALAFPSFWG